MEGVPAFVAPTALPGEKFLRFDWQKILHRGLDRFGAIAPGVALAGILALLGGVLAVWLGESVLGFERTPLSPILVTVMLGLAIRNTVGLPAAYEKGLRVCVRLILRIGVALLGLRLSLAAVGQIGFIALPVIVLCITVAIMAVGWLSRAAGLPPRLGSLIAVGTAICGVSAIVATGPAIDADDDEISYSVAVITLFGMVALFLYPALSHWLFAGETLPIGLFLGTAIHDTSQVAGAGLMYQMRYDTPEALDVAATTKLMRNLFMGAAIPLMAILHARRASAGAKSSSGRTRLKWNQWVPLFVIAFVALAGVRSVGDMGDRAFGFLDRGIWEEGIAMATRVSVGCLSVAMAAVGLGTGFAQFRRLGWKPLAVGLAAAVLVGGVSAGCILAMREFW